MGNFIGPEPVRSYAPLAVKDDFSGDGSTTTFDLSRDCLLYTSPSPRDRYISRMPSSA